LNAKDDPFLPEHVLPTHEEVSQYVNLEISDEGGHVGFISGSLPWRPQYWLEQRVPEFLKLYLA
jgi:predicted alpha/beta-fold hydrolase